MAQFLQYLISGVAQGATYALVALGFALIFGVSNILNIAHVETVMLAPAFAVILAAHTHLSPVLGLVIAFVLTVLAALAMHGVAVQPFLNRRRGPGSLLAPLIAALGVSIVVENVLSKQIGTSGAPFPLSVPTKVWHLPGSILLAPMDVVTICVTLILLLALGSLITRTDFGRSMRAVAENGLVARSLGISITRTVLIATIIAGSLGAIAGLLFAANTNSVTPSMGLSYGLIGLVALIIGGVTRLGGAVIAALGIGIVQAMSTGYLSSSYTTPITFGIMIVFLILRPQGVFAGVSREARP